MSQPITYSSSGVDIEAGDRAVDLIKKRAEETFRHYPGKVLSGIGGFSGIVELPDGRVMASSTDGVGTKLILAITLEKHDTIGIDLVAMSVNDIMVAGLAPAIFLDYIAMGKQVPERTEKIVNGILDGCEQAECALLGGEMAEMPGMYRADDYDVAGFAIGFANSKADLILGQDIKPGMKVYGFPSSGIHSNGYSLVRKIFNIDLENREASKKILETYYDELGKTLGEELLTPTTIYVKQIKELIKNYRIFGMAHITGGGLIENPPRVLPEGCAIKINKNSWKMPPIFTLMQKLGNIPDEDLFRTFNCGIGLIAVASDDIKEGILIGEVVEGNQEVVIN